MNIQYKTQGFPLSFVCPVFVCNATPLDSELESSGQRLIGNTLGFRSKLSPLFMCSLFWELRPVVVLTTGNINFQACHILKGYLLRELRPDVVLTSGNINLQTLPIVYKFSSLRALISRSFYYWEYHFLFASLPHLIILTTFSSHQCSGGCLCSGALFVWFNWYPVVCFLWLANKRLSPKGIQFHFPVSTWPY